MACKGKYEEWLKPANLEKITEWRSKGYSYERIAAEMGINATYFYEWLKKYPEITEALKKGDALLPRNIEQSFIDRLINGAKSIEIKKTFKKDDNGNDVETGRTETEKIIPVEPTLLIFYLCNLLGEKYKNAHTVDSTIQVEEKQRIDVKSLPKKDIIEFIKERHAERQKQEQPE